MSNLGAYQSWTTRAKKFGGPNKMMGAIVMVSMILGATVTLITKNKVDGTKKNKEIEKATATIYTVGIEGKSNEGLQFLVGEKFRVLVEIDENTVMIEKEGDNNNPHVVSSVFLSSISDYKNI